MTGPAGVRIAVALSGAFSAATWLAAVTLSGLCVDVPLHPRLPHAGAPHVAEPPSPPPQKAKQKLIEIAPWEQVPA
jgi:hypothetical protein